MTFDLTQDAFGVKVAAGDNGDADGGPLMDVLVVNFGHGAIEFLVQDGDQRSEDGPLLFQRVRIAKTKIELGGADKHGICLRARDLADFVHLQVVALFDVVVVVDADTALVSHEHFTGVVLEAFER